MDADRVEVSLDVSGVGQNGALQMDDLSLTCITDHVPTNLYVSLAGSNIWPYTNWSMAATSLATAVDAASHGDSVFVTSGVYFLEQEIRVTGRTVRIIGVDGASRTAIVATNGADYARCFDISHPGSVIEGLTLRGGRAIGNGGGIILSHGELRNCVIMSNSAASGGGITCGDGRVENCLIMGNEARYDGGGVYSYRESAIRNCIIRDNHAGEEGGGVYYNYGFLEIVRNCAIIRNVAGLRGGGVRSECFDTGSVWNSIIWSNVPDDYSYFPYNKLFCSCVPGVEETQGNTTNHPGLVDMAGDDFHLRAGSPCIDTGALFDEEASEVDIDGQPRIFNGRPDMGVDEAVFASRGLVCTGQSLDLAWDVVVGAACSLQCASSLDADDWQVVGNTVTADQQILNWSDTNSVSSSRFYRLRWE